MVIRKNEFLPVTMGHGCRNLLVYCISGRCHHSATMDGDWLDDDVPVRSLCGRMVCTRCGMIGADVQPDWRSACEQAPCIGLQVFGRALPLATCHAHVARHSRSLVSAINDKIMPLGLARDGFLNGGMQEIIALRCAERCT